MSGSKPQHRDRKLKSKQKTVKSILNSIDEAKRKEAVIKNIQPK